MCYNESNNITIKDLLPLFGALLTSIGTLVAIYSAYRGIAKKVKEDRKAKWIEDFRNEIANFSTQVISYSPIKDSENEQLTQIAKSGNLILLYLNDKNLKHLELQKVINKIIQMAVSESNRQQATHFPILFNQMMSLAREIILNEETAIK
jgi:hypothetical protein